jgi:hypothetical protein
MRVRRAIVAVRAMQSFASMISKRNINKVIKGAIAVLPAIPYITPAALRRSCS